MGARWIRTKDRAEVSSAYPPGTRLRCIKNGKTYQIGVRFGTGSDFWMMDEADGTRGKVDASIILKDFERAR